MAESRADFAIGSADLPLPSELSTASRLHTSYIYSHHRKRCKVDEHSVTVVVLCNLCVFFTVLFFFFLGGAVLYSKTSTGSTDSYSQEYRWPDGSKYLGRGISSNPPVKFQAITEKEYTVSQSPVKL